MRVHRRYSKSTCIRRHVRQVTLISLVCHILNPKSKDMSLRLIHQLSGKINSVFQCYFDFVRVYSLGWQVFLSFSLYLYMYSINKVFNLFFFMSMTIIYVHDGIFLDFLIKINYSANQNVHILIKQKKTTVERENRKKNRNKYRFYAIFNEKAKHKRESTDVKLQSCA